jgi:type II secretory pathway pseudopilin PulG
VNDKKYLLIIIVLILIGFSGWVYSISLRQSNSIALESANARQTEIQNQLTDYLVKYEESQNQVNELNKKLETITQDREAVKIQNTELTNKITALQTELDQAKQISATSTSTSSTSTESCAKYTLPEIDYSSNTAVAKGLKEFIKTARGVLSANDWNIIWKTAKTAIHYVSYIDKDIRYKEVFIVYYEDFNGPAIFWVNNACFLESKK